MRSLSAKPGPILRKPYRASAYVLPLVALPTVLGVGGHAGPSDFQTRSFDVRGTAVSVWGRALDRKIASHKADLLPAFTWEEHGLEEIVFARMPKRVQRHRMRVVKRERMFGLLESRDELDALLVAHEY